MANWEVVSAIERISASSSDGGDYCGVTPGAVALESGLPVEACEDELRALLRKPGVGVDFEFSGEGEGEAVRYRCPSNLSLTTCAV